MSLTPTDTGSDSSGARWQRIEALLVAAIDLTPEARAELIARECGDDDAMAAELRALLAAHDKAGMLDRPLARWSELAPSVEGLFFAPGAVIGQRYEILEQIGAGGMGVVYRARDLRLERTVALKFLPPSLSADDHAKRRFLTEARAAAALEHVNVCTVYEIGETESGQLFIAMALVEGESLRRMIERGPFRAGDAVDIARQLALALRAAHARGIVHRDVKPGNVMIGVGGVVKLVDFGIAKLEGSVITAGGVTPGTAAYMSPEQVRGDDVDHRTDLWALGIVLYEMLAGQRPFGGGTDATVTHAIATREPARLRSVDPEIPAALDEIVLRALAKDREQRFQTADEMLLALSRLDEAAAAIVRSPTRSRRAMIATLGTTAALVVAASIVGVTAWRRVVTQRARDAIPQIEQMAERGSYVEAYTLAAHASRALPGDSTLARLIPLVADRLTVESEPAGASVWMRRVRDDGSLAADSVLAGITPIRNLELARADYRLDIRKAGFAPAVRIASSALNRAEASLGVDTDVIITVSLREASRVPPGMLFVPGSRYALVGREAPTRDSVTLGDFFIDAFEVTNAEFREFVVAGGYADPKYWKQPFVLDGRAISWSDAMRRFVDRTALPGPRGWSSQEFAPNEARHPVTGVTWYEAAAFAEFAGKRLPTMFEWEKAARDGRYTHFDRIVMPWGLADPTHGVARRANFGSAGTEPVDSHASGLSPHGAYNMAGNVEEWVANRSGHQRFVTGGAWDDPMYVFANYLAVSGFHASPSLGFRCASDVPGSVAGTSNVEIPSDRGTPTYRAVDDATFQSLLRHYAYDPAPLEASVVARDTTRDWIRETIRIAGPWTDPTVVFLYLPIRTTHPLQTIAFVPGSNTFFEAAPSDETERIMTPHVKAGRAVFTVLFKGMVGRPWDAGHVAAPPASVQYRQELVKHATELRRSLDYLETRVDLDLTRLGYVGFSRGSGAWLLFAAVERRFRSVVFLGGGIDETFVPALPEARTVNFAPRIGAPTLLLNGRYDEEHPWISRGLPLWNLLREPKRLTIVDGGHLPRAEERVPVINSWFDETLGVVRSGPR